MRGVSGSACSRVSRVVGNRRKRALPEPPSLGLDKSDPSRMRPVDRCGFVGCSTLTCSFSYQRHFSK